MSVPDLSTARVLVVDDDASNRLLLETIVRGIGVGLVRSSDGTEHLGSLLEELDPAVLLLDLHIGGRNGLDLLRDLIANDPGWQGRRVVLVTGDSGAQVRERALALGAAEVVVKPYDPTALAELVTRLLLETGVVATPPPPAPAVVEVGDEFRTVFEQAPEPYVLLEPDLRIVAMSDEYLRVTGGRREDVVGRPLLDAFEHSADDPSWPEVRRQAEASFERVRRERRPDAMAVKPFDMRGENGEFETRYFSPASWPVLGSDGRLRWILHRLEDVTDFVRVQQHAEEQRGLTSQLQERTAHMEAEIYRRAQQIEQANRELRAANEAKREFLSRMSHELRTPLTSILGFGELLGLAELGEREQGYVRMLQQAGQHLLGLVNEVLDIARIEAGHLSVTVETVPVESLLRSVFELLQPLASSHGVSLEGDSWRAGKGYVAADGQRLRQVLINLVSNAVKYNRPGGSVRMSVVEQPDDRLRLVVTDTGRGLSREQLERLFVPFERLDAVRSTVEGTGLGLALSRELAEAMGGALGVTSRVGAGSTFWVELPSAAPVAVEELTQTDLARAAPRSFGGPRSVLYVEDLVANVELVSSILRLRPDVTLIPAMLGSLALDLAREHVPDLVLLDLHLPDMDGQQVLERLLGDPVTAQVPVVVFSADATGRQTQHLLAAGARAYLTKPIGVGQLLAAVDAFLAPSGAAAGPS